MAEQNAWTKKTLAQKILDRQVQYERLREPWDSRMAEIIDYCDPGLTEWSNRGYYSGASDSDSKEKGKFRGVKIYEGTPPWALRVMADGWIGSLISETLKWLKYLFPDKMLRDNDDVSKWMQDLEDFMYAVYRNSELYPALGPYARAGLSVGSPVILPWDDVKADKIKCEVPHPKENFHGPHESYHRKYKIDVLTAVKRFMGGKVPDNIIGQKLSYGLLDAWRNGRHAERFEFVRAIYQQDDPILDGQPAKFKNKPWNEFYVETVQSTSDEQQMNDPLQTEGGYFTKPHIKWDYEINTDEYYARTPSWHAIYDIRSSQELERQKLEAGQRALKQPMYVYRKYRNQFTGNPGSTVYYDTPAEKENKPEPIGDGTNYEVGDEASKTGRRGVERWYQTDFFQLVSRLTSENTGSWPTATQILKLEGEKAVVLSPRIGPFTNVLRQIDTRFIDIEQRKGTLPPPPDIVLEYMAELQAIGKDSISIQVEFIGPLAIVQQRAQTLGATEEGLGIIERYAALDPLLLKKVKLDVQMEKDLEAVRWSQDAIVPADEYEEMLVAIAEAEAQDKEALLGIEMAKASKDVSGPVDDSSILAKIGEAAA